MSDPNVEPTVGEPDIGTLQPSINGGATAVPAAPGTEDGRPVSEQDDRGIGEEGIDITSSDGPDL